MARSRPRQPGPIKRTIVTPATPHPSSTAMLRSPAPAMGAPAYVRNRRAVKMTAAQRDSVGNRSDWNRAANLRPWTTPMTAPWSSTATTMDRGGVYPTASSRTVPPAR